MARDGMLEVSPTVAIPRAELVYRATRAGGPGGQHVNTSSTRIELLWNLRTTAALEPEVRDRVAAQLLTKLDGEGWIRIVSASSRSQGQNREAAEERLVAMIRGALVVRKKRKPTKPTFGSKQARLEGKKKRGDTKRMRRPDFD
jgi:ribosome-associated protein